MKQLAIYVVLLLQFQLGFSQQPLKIDWDSDLDLLAKELPDKHVNFFTLKSKKEFLSQIEKIRKNKDALSDFEITMRLQQLIASFGDAHTTLNFNKYIDKNKILPLILYWFSDGLYILQTTPANKEILGQQILSINGVPLKKVTEKLSTLYTVDNPANLKTSIPNLLPCLQILQYFKFATSDSVNFELMDVNGVKNNYFIKPAEFSRQNRVKFKPDSVALCYYDEKSFFVDYFIEPEQLYYFQYNKCWSKEVELKYGNALSAEKMLSFTKMEEKFFQTLSTQSIRKVVFDLRFNGGGNSEQGTAFIEKYANYLKTHSEIKTYVILGRNTFSSAIINAMDFKNLTNAIFVGEETSGKPNHFGEVKKFQLSSSQLVVNYSTKYFKRTEEASNSIVPEITQETRFTDFIKGLDPAYSWILKQ